MWDMGLLFHFLRPKINMWYYSIKRWALIHTKLYIITSGRQYGTIYKTNKRVVSYNDKIALGKAMVLQPTKVHPK